MTDLLPTLKELIARQFEASLSALHLAIARCPDELWSERVAKWQFCQAAFHAVFFTDVYLQPTDDETAIKRQAFHASHAGAFRDYEELADRAQVLTYDRPFVVVYLNFVRQKAQATLAAESADVLAGPSGFAWRKCTRAELHVYNIRHVQHHAAQVALRLRQADAAIDLPWVGHVWKDA